MLVILQGRYVERFGHPIPRSQAKNGQCERLVPLLKNALETGELVKEWAKYRLNTARFGVSATV